MQINEIFSSIEGEGLNAGYLSTFIRTQFCNCKCSYCDSLYTLDALDEKGEKQYIEMTIDDIVDNCKKLKNERVTFTGGEPLIQEEAPELVLALVEAGFKVNIETNGAVDLRKFLVKCNYEAEDTYFFNQVIFTMDYKCPSSMMEDKMITSNFNTLKEKDALKFVVGTNDDLNAMQKIIKVYNPRCSIFVSPVFGKIDPKDIIKYLKENDLQNVRLQLQLHKIIYPVDMRGV